jgi:hypothetical protein
MASRKYADVSWLDIGQLSITFLKIRTSLYPQSTNPSSFVDSFCYRMECRQISIHKPAFQRNWAQRIYFGHKVFAIALFIATTSICGRYDTWSVQGMGKKEKASDYG